MDATKWEAEQTMAYLEFLESRLGPLRRVVSEGLEERTRRLGTFPSRARKWCSPELKVQMTAQELLKIRDETGDDVEVVIGFRREESDARAAALEREWSDAYDCEVWRPILDWTVQDVIAEHHRAHIPLNPLYLLGAERVGCWPCIHAGKAELRLVGEIDPERIERIAQMETDVGQTMFCLEKSRKGGTERALIPTPIQKVVHWARTSRGGRQLTMIPEASGCQRWGTCELPKAEKGSPS